MNKRSFGLVLSGMFGVAVTALVAPGCGGHSVRGDCLAACRATCETGDACESYAGFFPVDREDCLTDCDGTCEDYEDSVYDTCDDGVEIHGDQVDRCLQAIDALGNYCRADDESEINEARLDVADECGNAEDLIECL